MPWCIPPLLPILGAPKPSIGCEFGPVFWLPCSRSKRIRTSHPLHLDLLVKTRAEVLKSKNCCGLHILMPPWRNYALTQFAERAMLCAFCVGSSSFIGVESLRNALNFAPPPRQWPPNRWPDLWVCGPVGVTKFTHLTSIMFQIFLSGKPHKFYLLFGIISIICSPQHQHFLNVESKLWYRTGLPNQKYGVATWSADGFSARSCIFTLRRPFMGEGN